MRDKFSIRVIDEQGFHKSLCQSMKFRFYFDYDDLILFKTKEKAIEFFENNIPKKDKCRYYILQYKYDKHFKHYDGEAVHFF